MTEPKCFIDTNLLVYFYSTDSKSAIVEGLIRANFDEICLSTQVLNELYCVLTRKKLKTKEEAQAIINDLIENYKIYCLDERGIKRGIELNIQYQLSYWDSLILASAIEAGCTKLYSEDLQHNQVIQNGLTIINPFN
ncbi:MAG: PIN domain-containing protein [Candidatus Riflebacteria bacterium]|nr:PIN domain-containing protein [Candidatus Riflebacteria bacterium]